MCVVLAWLCTERKQKALKRVSKPLQITSDFAAITEAKAKATDTKVTLDTKKEKTRHLFEHPPYSYTLPSSVLFRHFKPNVLVSLYPQLCGYACTGVPLNHDLETGLFFFF